MTPATTTAAPRGRRGGFGSVLMRLLPGESPLRHAWAGTKVLCLLAATGVSLYLATWWSLGAVLLLLGLAVRAGRVPRTAWPSLPPWFWAMLVGGGIGAALGGGLSYYLIATGISLAVVAAALVVTWTTPLGELAPAVAALLRPLRIVRAPVDEWALTVGLVVRAIPPLIDELGTVFESARLRPRPAAVRGMRGTLRTWWTVVGDALVTVLAVTTRRGADTGTAMLARGGPAPLRRDPVRLRAVDWACLAVTVAVLAVPVAERVWRPFG